MLGGVYEAWRSIERADGPLQPSPEKHCPPITHTKSSSLHHSFISPQAAKQAHYLDTSQNNPSIYLSSLGL